MIPFKNLRLSILILGLIYSFLSSSADVVFAHGFGERYDLPLPLWLYTYSAGGIVLISFLLIVSMIRPMAIGSVTEKLSCRLIRFTGRIRLIQIPMIFTIQCITVFLLVLVCTAGFVGTQTPSLNIAPTLIWIIWWVGVAFASALIGNIWELINPWSTIYQWTNILFRRHPQSSQSMWWRIRYPQQIGCMPAIILLVAFAWVELAYGESSNPQQVSQLVAFYSIVTLSGMALFGRNEWLRYGEPFSIIFSLFAQFSPIAIAITDRSICQTCPAGCLTNTQICIDCLSCNRSSDLEAKVLIVRPFGLGLSRPQKIEPTTMFLILILLATVTFDGLMATSLWSSFFKFMLPITPDATTITTIGLFITMALFVVVYLLTIGSIRLIINHDMDLLPVGTAYILSLVPIALAYHLAHYLSYLLIQGQRIVGLISDPFGLGWDIFGTAAFEINIGIIDAKFAWIAALIAIVTGHVVAVFIGHAVTSRYFQTTGKVFKSQIPLLFLMVGYTIISLWILAQPIIEINRAV